MGGHRFCTGTPKHDGCGWWALKWLLLPLPSHREVNLALDCTPGPLRDASSLALATTAAAAAPTVPWIVTRPLLYVANESRDVRGVYVTILVVKYFGTRVRK